MVEANHFIISCCKKKYVFLLSDVIRLEAKSNYTMIYASNSEPILVAKVLLKYEAVLHQNGFIRVHHSHLVNKLFIWGISQKGDLILMDESRVEVSRRRRKKVRQEFKNYEGKECQS
jgi:two-component system, LytTR family, response regulator